jgi:DNA-binding CsgD family transcriptional regulator
MFQGRRSASRGNPPRSAHALRWSRGRSERIAERMAIRPNTVRAYIQNILTKLQANSRLEAAAFAVKHGLVGVRRERRRPQGFGSLLSEGRR